MPISALPFFQKLNQNTFNRIGEFLTYKNFLSCNRVSKFFKSQFDSEYLWNYFLTKYYSTITLSNTFRNKTPNQSKNIMLSLGRNSMRKVKMITSENFCKSNH